MKKILLITMLMVASVGIQHASAQSLQSLFDGLSKMLGDQSESSPKTTKVAYPTEKEIMGRWSYQQLVMEYTGDSTLASLAVGSAASQLPSMATKAGLAAGKDYVRVKSDGTIQFVSGDKKATARYTYVAPTGQMIVSIKHADQTITLTGHLSKVDGKLKILFKANEVVAKADMISDKFKDNTTFTVLKELINSYPGIMGGALFSK